MGRVIFLGTCMLLSGCGSLDKLTANAASLFEKKIANTIPNTINKPYHGINPRKKREAGVAI